MNHKIFMPQDIKNPFMRAESLMIPMNEIPNEFSMMRNNKWVKLFDDMFFKGITLTKVEPKQGIDKDKALKHIRVIATSWDCKHEHKTACCAYLFSLWFDNIEYTTNKNN